MYNDYKTKLLEKINITTIISNSKERKNDNEENEKEEKEKKYETRKKGKKEKKSKKEENKEEDTPKAPINLHEKVTVKLDTNAKSLKDLF